MKTTGITRRIDELGRIVIPKEIRKNMRIKPGTLLEIYLSDLDTIVLKKHSIISNEQTFIKDYIKKLARVINGNIFLASLDEIIFSSNEKLNGVSISNDLETMIKEGSVHNNIENLYLTNDDVIQKPFDIYPLAPNGDILGLLILDYKNSLSEEDKTLMKFSIMFLSDYLEES